MKILITGGAGFIGSHLAEEFYDTGYLTIALDNLLTGTRKNLRQLLVLEGDITDLNDLCNLDPDIIIHCAASYNDPNNWQRDTKTNVLGAVNLVKMFPDVKHIVYFQTSLCYGINPKETPITLNHPLEPVGSYAISKVAGEQYLRESGIPLTVLRLANIYGPRNLSGPVPVFYKHLSTGKPCTIVNTRRDYVFVSDLVRLVKMVIDRHMTGTFHVGSGKDYAIRTIHDTLAHIMKIDSPVKSLKQRGDDDTKSILLDTSKTYKVFDWFPLVSLAEGLTETIEWYKEFGVGDTFTHLRGQNEQ